MLKGSSFRLLCLDIYANVQRELTHIYTHIERLHILLRVHIYVLRYMHCVAVSSRLDMTIAMEVLHHDRPTNNSAKSPRI